MTQWLEAIMGPDLAPMAAMIVWTIIIIVAIIVGLWLYRGFISSRFRRGWNGEVRLDIVDAAAIDNRRRLVLVRRDDVEHLIVIGGHNDFVVESGIQRSTAKLENKPLPANPQRREPTPVPTSSPPPENTVQRSDLPARRVQPQPAPAQKSQPPAVSKEAAPTPPKASVNPARMTQAVQTTAPTREPVPAPPASAPPKTPPTVVQTTTRQQVAPHQNRQDPPLIDDGDLDAAMNKLINDLNVK